VVDHELDGLERVDLPRVAPIRFMASRHRGEVDDGRDAGEVLEEHAARAERDLARGDRLGVPGGEGPDVVGGDRLAVFVPQEVFQKDLQRERQPRQVDPGRAQGVEPVRPGSCARRP